jgi:hypothetical protein
VIAKCPCDVNAVHARFAGKLGNGRDPAGIVNHLANAIEPEWRRRGAASQVAVYLREELGAQVILCDPRGWIVVAA